MDTTKKYQYKWSGFEACISWSRIFKCWRWSVNSVNNDYVNFQCHIDSELETPKEAEEDMLYEIRTHIGSTPEKQF